MIFIPRSNTIHEPITEPITNIQIVNLSSQKLNETEIKLLGKGLKFTPHPKRQIHKNWQKISEFTRKYRLVEYFEGMEHDDEFLVRNKSNFVPPNGREQLLDNFVENTINIPLEAQDKSKIKRNINSSDQNALSSLANDSNIIIKQADKGGATVIMDKPFYQEQIENMLFNTEYYHKLDGNPHK